MSGRITEKDSRNRKDIRALEEGRIQTSQKERISIISEEVGNGGGGGSNSTMGNRKGEKNRTVQRNIQEAAALQTKEIVPYEEIVAKTANLLSAGFLEQKNKVG